jgi:hypothetical protein
MIAIEKDQFSLSAGQNMAGAMRKGMRGWLFSAGTDHLVMRDAPECDDRAKRGEFLDRGLQEWAAGGNFSPDRLIARGDTAHGIGDHGCLEAQTILRMTEVGILRKAEPKEGAIKQVAGVIASEGPTGPVRAAQARREAHD